MPFLLRIPPASLNKQWAPYIRMLAQQNLGNRRMTPSDVVTRITFDAATQGVLNFSPVGFISQEQLAQVQRAQAADLTAQIVGKNDQAHQGALPAPAAQPQLAAQAPIPQQAPVQQFQTAPQIPGGQQAFQPQYTQAAQTPLAPAPQFAPTLQQAAAVIQPFLQNTQVAPASQQFAPQPQAQQPQQEPARRTRRGRTNPPVDPVQNLQPTQTPYVDAAVQAQQPVQQAPIQQFAQPPAAPAFMMGGAQPVQQMAQPLQQAPVQTAQAPSHGMVSAPPPTAELAATLANAFGPQGGQS